jgi:hypothetical protein
VTGNPASSPRQKALPLGVVLGASAAVLVAASVMAASRLGPGLNADSTYYLSSGINLARGEGLRSFDGAPLILFGPGLPLVVAIGSWFGANPETVVRVFNPLAFAAAVWLAWILTLSHIRAQTFRLAVLTLPWLQCGAVETTRTRRSREPSRTQGDCCSRTSPGVSGP